MGYIKQIKLCVGYYEEPGQTQHREVVQGTKFSAPGTSSSCCGVELSIEHSTPLHELPCPALHQTDKVMCHSHKNHTKTNPARGGAVKVRISIAQLLTCGQIYPPAYQPAELHGPAARIARIERVKLRAGLNETKKNGSATGVARGTGIQLQCSIMVLNRANTLFRTDCNTVFIGNIKLCASGSSAIFRNTCSTLIKLTAKEIEISPFG